MNSGFYALACLDGLPLDAGDMLVLGLAAGHLPEPADGFSARVQDAENLGAADWARDPQGQVFFLGFLDWPEQLGVMLGCASRSAAIALAAIRRWGPATMDHLKGEWSLLYWEPARRELWLGVSRAMRDKIYFACDGRKLAVSGDLRRLGALTWVGSRFDPEGVAYSMRRADASETRNGRSILRGVSFVEAGTFHRFGVGGQHDIFRHAPDEPVPWQGDFLQAVATLEQELRMVVRRMLSRHQVVAVLLSGGLDSALVAWLVSEERRPGQKVVCLTAVSPPGCPYADERELAKSVSEALGLEQRLVWPDGQARIFRPFPTNHSGDGPPMSPRHYLSDALLDAARDFGATGLFDGTGGELSVTRCEVPNSIPAQIKAILRWGREAYHHRRTIGPRRLDAYHTRLSSSLLAELPGGFTGPRPPSRRMRPLAPETPMGFVPGYHKAWEHDTSKRGGGLRLLSPLCDPHVVAVVAGMPAGFTFRDGQQRTLAREMLKGHVPEHVRLQSKGLPFSVDYEDRLRREAPQIQDRLAEWRNAGADAWLDLDWLESEARRMVDGTLHGTAAHFRLQLTAIAAEFFTEWQKPRN